MFNNFANFYNIWLNKGQVDIFVSFCIQDVAMCRFSWTVCLKKILLHTDTWCVACKRVEYLCKCFQVSVNTTFDIVQLVASYSIIIETILVNILCSILSKSIDLSCIRINLLPIHDFGIWFIAYRLLVHWIMWVFQMFYFIMKYPKFDLLISLLILSDYWESNFCLKSCILLLVTYC